MTQMDLLTKHVMGGGYKAVKVVGVNSGVNPEDDNLRPRTQRGIILVKPSEGFSSELSKVRRESRLE
ncbi:hypothetical protein MTR67_026291 [Solanum verrucosum]|uniref:Uncharacterized protein n=1 Tax=Solanum verrucosum TaxID=315347 RepID=A0AAF0R6V3_SOLVR|nr:hypothetical protein MTR67_026291 [Solanum verrucosum]